MLISSIIIQIIYYVGFIVLFGFLIALINKTFYRNLGYSKFVIYSTGLLGTPIHELSHALMCVLFGHKITEVSLFRISDDGVLGYVNHSYNPKNIYHQIGNYFIGVAPIIVGSIILYFGTFLLVPTASNSINSSLVTFVASQSSGFSFKTLLDVLTLGKDFIVTIALNATFTWQYILYIVAALCLSLHMNLSNADIKGALKGLPLFLILLIIVNLIIYYVPFLGYTGFNNLMVMGGAYLLGTLIISFVFSLILLVLSALIKLAFRRR